MRWIIKCLLLIMVCIPVQGWAFQNEPIGFRDLYWGESLEEVKQTREVKYLAYDEKNNSVIYVVHFRTDEPKILSRMPILGENFLVAFWHGKLRNIELLLPADAFSFLREAMIRLYGNPQSDKWDNCAWIGETTVIILDRDLPVKNVSRLVIGSRKIAEDLIKERARQGW